MTVLVICKVRAFAIDARASTVKSVYVKKYREELNVDGIKCYCIISAIQM